MTQSTSPSPPLDLAVRIGCEIIFEAPAQTPITVSITPRQDRYQLIRQQSLQFEPLGTTTEFQDDHGNAINRLFLQPGRNTLRYDAIVMVPSATEDFMHEDGAIPPHLLQPEILRYILPSRYCDSDKLLDFAWQNFGHLPNGLPRVLAIRQWLNENIEYRTGSGSTLLSANDIIQRRYGVCRDFAHTLVALCRTFNLPARYVSGFVPDIGVASPGTPEDFHAYCEVWLADHWQVFDARFPTPRVGRVRICSGYDAGNCAFTTIYGAATLAQFYVWSYQVDPEHIHIGDPIDLTKRLCGTPVIRFHTV